MVSAVSVECGEDVAVIKVKLTARPHARLKHIQEEEALNFPSHRTSNIQHDSVSSW